MIQLGGITIVVTGFGRCGSTLVMRMLHAGGVPVYCDNLLDFETEAALQLPGNVTWLSDARGRAVKVLDPMRAVLPRGRSYRFLWCDRDPKEQARSMGKLMRDAGSADLSRDGVRQMAASLEKDKPKTIAWLRNYPLSVVRSLRFEQILLYPMEAARQLAEFAPGLDVVAAAREVVTRPPQNHPGRLEYTLAPHARRDGDAGLCR